MGQEPEVERQRKETEKALREARARGDALRQPQINYAHLNSLLLQLNAMDLLMATPEDRRRLYGALRLRADVDANGQVRLSGSFDPDMYLPGVLQNPPDWLSPRPEAKERSRMVVTSGDTLWRT